MHLDCKWVIPGITYLQGDIKDYDDVDPDKPVLVLKKSEDLKEYDRGSAVVHISLKHGLRHLCPHCMRPAKVKEWVTTTYQTSSICGLKGYARITTVKLECEDCNKTPKVHCPLVRKNSQHTKTLEIDVLRHMLDNTVKDTAEELCVSPNLVQACLKNVVLEGISYLDLSNVKELYVDEIQFGHGQDYVTVFTDQDHNVIFICHDHTADSFRQMSELLEARGGKVENIRFISMDMSTAYRSGAATYFPDAVLVLDRFHLVKHINEALDTVRKRVYKELSTEDREDMGKIKYTVLYRERNHDEKHRARMEKIRLRAPELALAFDLKEEFADIFEIRDWNTARRAFADWYQRVLESGIPEMVDKAESIMNRLADIMPWFVSRMSNGVAEGINNALKKTKSAAYGYRNVDNFIHICYFRHGRLPVRV